MKELLVKLERGMRATSLWSVEPPSEAAFQSIQPFCIDTMSFWCWLQYVFIPKMRRLLDLIQPLPTNCCLLPLAEMAAAKEAGNLTDVLLVVSHIDDCFK